MIGKAAVAVASATLAAFAIGWFAPGRPPAPLVVTRFPQITLFSPIQRPDAAANAALADLNVELTDAEPTPKAADPRRSVPH